jgi:hypothetical protein
MAAQRKRFRGGRPLQRRACPRCDTPCASTTQAAAHCVGRKVQAEPLPAAAPLQRSEPSELWQEFPKMKYHSSGRFVTVKDAQAEAALGEGWGDKPI